MLAEMSEFFCKKPLAGDCHGQPEKSGKI